MSESVSFTVPLVPRKWSGREKAVLAQFYPDMGLNFCAGLLGRSTSSIRQQASEMKLRINRKSEFFNDFQRRAAASKVGKKRPEQAIVMKQLHASGKLVQDKEVLKGNAKRMNDLQKENGHPRGTLGMKHSDEAKMKMAKKSRERWADPNYSGNSEDYRQKLSDRMSKLAPTRTGAQNYSRAKRGRRPDIGPMFFRSRWEANYARYLNWLKDKGEIHEWKYESKTFWFEAIKRGVRSYTPDFEVFDAPYTESRFVEVKGWMDDKSKTKLKRMAKYYPAVRVEVFGSREYQQLKRELSPLLPGWEKG